MKRLIWFVQHIEELLMMILLCVIVAVMGTQIFMRYVMNNSLYWAEETARFLFIWFASLSFSYCIKVSKHLRIDMLLDAVPQMVKKVFNIITIACTLLFTVYLLWAGVDVMQRLMASQQKSAAIGLPMEYIYLGMFVGLSLSIIRIIQRLFQGKLLY